MDVSGVALPAGELSHTQSWSVAQERLMGGAIAACGWCPTMDLLALLVDPFTPLPSTIAPSSFTSSAPVLHIHRLTSDEPRLFSLLLLDSPHGPRPSSAGEAALANAVEDEVEAMGGCHVAWRGDGKAVAVATREGGVQVVGMESRKVEVAYQPHRPHSITALQWPQLPTERRSQLAAEGRKRKARTRQAVAGSPWKAVNVSSVSLPLRDPLAYRHPRTVFAPLPPLPSHTSSASSGPAPSPVPQSSSAATSSSDAASSTLPTSIIVDGDALPPSLLVTGDSGGFVHGRLHATLDAFHLDVRDCLPHSAPSTSHSVHSLALSPSFDSLHVVVRSDESHQQPQLLLVRIDLSPLSQRIHELSLLTCHVQHINRLLSYTSASLASVQSRYHSIRQSLSNKLSGLIGALTEHGLPDASPVEHLSHLALTSIPSPPVLQWLNSSLHPAALLRQCAGVESGLWRMMEVLRVNVRRAMEELVHRLAELRGLSRWKERAGGLGVEEEAVTGLLQHAGVVLLRAEEMLALIGSVRRGFTAFFHWLAYQVSVLQREDEEGDKEQPSGPFELDDVLDCIQQDLFNDRLQLLPSTAAPPLSALSTSVSFAVTSLPVSAIPAAASPISLDTALEALHRAFADFTQAPCTAISQSIAQAQRRTAGERVSALKVAHEQPAGGEAAQDVALSFEEHRERALLAFSVIHPLAPHPLLVVTSTPSTSSTPRPAASTPASSALVLPCPGLTGSSQPSVVSVAFFSPSSLLLLVRYAVHRRSSELRLLHEKEKMAGNVYTRLYRIPLQGKRGWRALREAELRRDGLSLADWAAAEWEKTGAGGGRSARRWKQRSFYGDCGRSLSVGRERGVVSLLLTALQPHRARHQQRRLLTLDLQDDDEEEQRGADEGGDGREVDEEDVQAVEEDAQLLAMSD